MFGSKYLQGLPQLLAMTSTNCVFRFIGGGQVGADGKHCIDGCNVQVHEAVVELIMIVLVGLMFRLIHGFC